MLASAQARREEVGGEMETAESQIRVVEEELDCIEKRSAGEDCVSLLGNLSTMAQEGYARIRDLVGRAGEIVTTTVKLMIFVIVKNILLPIALLDDCRKVRSANCQIRGTADFRFQTRRKGTCGHGLTKSGQRSIKGKIRGCLGAPEACHLPPGIRRRPWRLAPRHRGINGLAASSLALVQRLHPATPEKAMSIICSIPETIAGSAVRGFGFAFGRDIYSATKKRSQNILLIAIAVAVLLMNYVSVLWIVRNYQTASQSVLAKLGGLIAFAASYALVFVVSTWVGEEVPALAAVIVVVQHGLILAGLINGLRHRRKRRLVWEAEDHNAEFFLEHGIEELDEEHYRDSEGNRYRLAHVRPGEIELVAEGKRGKRAYIGVDEEGRFTTWSGMTSA